MSIKSRILVRGVSIRIAVGLGLIAFFSGTSFAAPLPVMPTNFDLPTVQRYIDGVDQGQNELILRLGYLARRGTRQAPGEKGMALLQAAIDKEPIGSHRWFLLKSLMGYGSMRLKPDSLQKGFDAYQDVFEQAQTQLTVGKLADENVDVVTQAIVEFVNILPTGFASQGGADMGGKVVNKAFNLWIVLPESKQESLKYQFPTWGSNNNYTGNDFDDNVKEQFFGINAPTNLRAYIAAASALFRLNPPSSQKYLDLAKPLIFPAKVDTPYQRYWTALQVPTFLYQGRTAEGVALQKEVIAQTGNGYTDLVRWLIKYRAWKELSSTLGEISTQIAQGTGPSSEESVLMASIVGQEKWRNKDDMPEEMVLDFLRIVQKSPRARSVALELQARLSLIKFLNYGADRRAKNLDELTKLLSFDETKVPKDDGDAQALWQEFKALKDLILPTKA